MSEKCPNTEFFLVHIFSHSDWIRRDTPYLSVFSLNAGNCGPEKTPYLDTFQAVLFCDPPPHLPFISKTDLLFKNHRTHKHLANFTPPPANLFHVDVINVLSLIRVKATFNWKKITFLRSPKLKHMIWKINTALLKKVKKLLTGGVSTCNFQERWIMKYN